jgi:hypothetical protein
MVIWLMPLVAALLLLFVPVWAYRVGLRDSGSEVQADGRRRLVSLYCWFAFAVATFIGGWLLADQPNPVLRGLGVVALVTALGFVVVRIEDGCALVVAFFRIGRSARSNRLNLCPKCEYDLTGNESRVCPECGLRLPGRRSFR